tara:strand:- start:653 stop:859 length:207 start_codon:yes stop_codon:yes gene_type:complete
MYAYAKVDVLCEDNGKVISSDVVNYKQNSYLTVDVGGMQLNLQYDNRNNNYRTTKSGLDFVAKSPKEY